MTHTRRAIGQHASESGAMRCSATYSDDAASSKNGDNSPVMPIRISAMPNAASGEKPRRRTRLDSALPIARSGHERGEHGAGGIDRDAEHHRQPAQPQDLVDEAGDARDVEQRKRPPAGTSATII